MPISNKRRVLGSYMGIDPGASGGAAIVGEQGGLIDLLAFNKCGTEYEVYDWLKAYRDRGIEKVAIEQVHSMPKQGVASSFKFGKSYGFLIGVVTALQIPLVFVTPQSWQKYMKCLTGGNKNISKAAAHRLYPTFSKFLTHATADAALIATWCHLTNTLGENK